MSSRWSSTSGGIPPKRLSAPISASSSSLLSGGVARRARGASQPETKQSHEPARDASAGRRRATSNASSAPGPWPEQRERQRGLGRDRRDACRDERIAIAPRRFGESPAVTGQLDAAGLDERLPRRLPVQELVRAAARIRKTEQAQPGIGRTATQQPARIGSGMRISRTRSSMVPAGRTSIQRDRNGQDFRLTDARPGDG